MQSLLSLFTPFSSTSINFEDHFVKIASFFLNKISFVVAQEPYQFVEIEFYYQSTQHPDPFVHASPLQKTLGRWYFHREGKRYRDGSFKGLDISFGSADAFGGILIRTIQAPDGTLINGCSLCVDHLLQKTGFRTVAELDQAIQERKIWDETNLLYLQEKSQNFSSELYQSPRVGLTLKRIQRYPEMTRYVMKPYRFLTDPTLKKGKVHTILGLIRQGKSFLEIQQLTQSSEKTIQNYWREIEAGKQLKDFESYAGKSLSSEDVARLYGTCQTLL